MSEPKYSKGQKIKIVRVQDVWGKLKYPSLDDHVGKVGIIAEPPYGIKPTPVVNLPGSDKDAFMYFVNLGEESLVCVFEDMIQPVAN
jgi:hypothetical protein